MVEQAHSHQQRALDSYECAEDGPQHGAQSDGVRSCAPRRRIEVIMGDARRRRWSREEKTRITALSFEPGCNVSALAREHGVSIGLLHQWRRMARARADEGALKFVPLVAAERSAARRSDGCVIEVDLCGASVRILGEVDRAMLASVLAAVRASA